MSAPWARRKHYVTQPCNCPGALEAERKAKELQEVKAEAERRRNREKAYLAAVQTIGIPKRFRDVEPDMELAAKIKDGNGLYFYGKPGTYKTTTACATLKAYMWEHDTQDVKYANVPRMFGEIKSTYDRKTQESETDVMRVLTRCRLLVLDDLGKGELKAWGLERLYTVINDRYDEMLSTVITSQYDMGRICERLAMSGDEDTAIAITRRIAETCEFIDFDKRKQ